MDLGFVVGVWNLQGLGTRSNLKAVAFYNQGTRFRVQGLGFRTVKSSRISRTVLPAQDLGCRLESRGVDVT